MINDWSDKEINLIVEDYFSMLHQELAHQTYNKSEHRRQLSKRLNKRTNGSIEFKHQNISAALIAMGLPFISGYKARSNYQTALEKGIADFVSENQDWIEKDFERFSTETVNKDIEVDVNFADIVDTDPVISKEVTTEPKFKPFKTNFLEKEQNARKLGEAGEQLIMNYERWRLSAAGKPNLAESVEWISKDKGDGAGFDILSKNNNGTDRYIEVKTTKLTKETPIYFSRNEMLFASTRSDRFYLYRVFNFDSNPRFFIKQGKYEGFCILQPQTYKGYFS
jgi:hypothetical protein